MERMGAVGIETKVLSLVSYFSSTGLLTIAQDCDAALYTVPAIRYQARTEGQDLYRAFRTPVTGAQTALAG